MTKNKIFEAWYLCAGLDHLTPGERMDAVAMLEDIIKELKK